MFVLFLNLVPQWKTLGGPDYPLPSGLEAVSGLEPFRRQGKGENWGIVCCPAAELTPLQTQLAWQNERLLFILAGEVARIPGHPENRECIFDVLEPETKPAKTLFAVTRATMEIKRKQDQNRLQSLLALREQEMQDLNRIGIALSSQHDINRLLDQILTESVNITDSDGGSLYLVVDQDKRLTALDGMAGEKNLMFKITMNFSREMPFSEFVMPINNKSISGYCAANGRILNLPDVYRLPSGTEFAVNKYFDEKNKYRTTSMLVVPMKNTEGDVLGVIQLINKKDSKMRLLKAENDFAEWVKPYSSEDEALLSSLGSQAAVALENAKLVDDITHLFEGIIMACNSAMEQRDPPTSGHSVRISKLTLKLAELVNRVQDGPLAQYNFDERKMTALRYACLLHDFGKICVPENVLLKPKKLWEYQIDNIRQRFRLVKNLLRTGKLRAMMESGGKLSPAESEKIWSGLEGEISTQIRALDDDLQCILEANEPRVLADESSGRLKVMGERIYPDPEGHGEPVRLLTPYEVEQLSIKRGSLNEAERREMENHVTYTYQFLTQIPWTKHLRQVPLVASSHHEYLNGSGYPRKMSGGEIPLEAQMMSIADIFDALTAQDRPYKKAVPLAKALEIVGDMVKRNLLNKDLWELFLKEKVYEVVISQPTPA